MAWIDEAKKRLSQVSPQSEDYAALTSAIADVESPRETRGAKEGFISQQYPTSTQPFEPGDYIENKDGGWSSERTITVTDPRLNNGKPTVIPSLWKKGGNPTDLSEEDSVKAAISSGRAWPSFRDIPEAERFANDREDTWQRVGPKGAGTVPSLTQIANKTQEYDPERGHRTAMGAGPYSMVSQMYPETIVPEEGLSRKERSVMDYRLSTAESAAREAARRPSEHIAPPGMFNTLSPLDQIRENLPTWMGGKTQMWEEPKLIEFRSDPTMRDMLGPGIDKLGTDSPEYQSFADRKWAEAYDTAAHSAEGVRQAIAAGADPSGFGPVTDSNIVRQSATPAFSNPLLDIGASANRGLTNLGRGIDSAIGGAANVVTPGLQDESMKAAADEMPFIGGLGGLAGAFASPLAKGATELVGLNKAKGVASMAGRGALAGGATAGLTQGLQDVGDQVRGNPHSDEMARIAEAMAFGTGGGALAGTGGALTRSLRDSLTAPGRELNLLETALAGGENNPPVRATRFLGGLKVTPGAEAAAQESQALGPNRGVEPTDILAGKVAGPIAKTALRESAELKAHIESTNQSFYNSRAGQSQVAPRAFVGALRNRIEKGTFDDGSPLPLEHGAELKKALNDSVELFPVKPGDEGSWAKRYNGNVISVREANQLGLRVGGEETDKVIMIPKPMNAEQMDITLRNVDSNANAASIRGSKDPVWGELQRAGRVDRDRFGSDMSLGKVEPVTLPDGTQLKGWGAYKHHAHEQITDLERRMVNAGIPQGEHVGLEQATEGVRQNAIGFRGPGRSVQDNAVMSFMGGQTSPLWDITSARYGRTLQPSNSLSRTSVLRNAELRLDPTFARLEKAAMPIGIAAGAGDLGPGMVAGYHDLRDLTPFTFQDMLSKLRGEQKPHENHPRKRP